MTKKSIIKQVAFAAALVLFSSQAFGQNQQKVKDTKPVYFHYLVFWLKPDLSTKEVEDFKNFFKGLSELPYQKNLQFGTPADSTPRAVLDKTYTYSVAMEFDSLEDLEAYGKLPAHLALVAKYKPYFSKMLVHDTVFQSIK